MAISDNLKRYFDGLSTSVQNAMADSIVREANGLAAAIKARAPSKTGALKNSVQVVRKGDLSVAVVAGGDATTTRSGSGVLYDHALATEYGTAKEPAEPFFFSTARAMQAEIKENIQESVAEAIK